MNGMGILALAVAYLITVSWRTYKRTGLRSQLYWAMCLASYIPSLILYSLGASA